MPTEARRCELINNSDVAILTGYNALMRGFAEYYKLGTLRGTTLWTQVKAARTRKRVVLCRDCHAAHHAGRLQERLDRMVPA